MNKHSPEPWQMGIGSSVWSGGKIIARVSGHTDDEALANAAIMSGSLRLLTLCREFLHVWDRNALKEKAILRKIRAVIREIDNAT